MAKNQTTVSLLKGTVDELLNVKETTPEYRLLPMSRYIDHLLKQQIEVIKNRSLATSQSKGYHHNLDSPFMGYFHNLGSASGHSFKDSFHKLPRVRGGKPLFLVVSPSGRD